jgi:hypothetical protein
MGDALIGVRIHSFIQSFDLWSAMEMIYTRAFAKSSAACYFAMHYYFPICRRLSLISVALSVGIAILATAVNAAVVPPGADAAAAVTSTMTPASKEIGLLMANGKVALPRDCAACAAVIINAIRSPSLSVVLLPT